MADPQPITGTRPAGAPPYDPVVRLATSHPVLFPPDESEVDDDVAPPTAAPALATPTHPPAVLPASRPASKLRWYVSVASGLGGALLATAIYGVVISRSGPPSSRGDSARGGVAVSDTAVLDRRADTLALAIGAFNIRASMFDSRRMPCSGLARGLTQVEDAWLGYNIARKDLLAGSDPARDARDKSLYADVRGVEVKFERSSCTRP